MYTMITVLDVIRRRERVEGERVAIALSTLLASKITAAGGGSEWEYFNLISGFERNFSSVAEHLHESSRGVDEDIT